MARFRKLPVIIEATQFFELGDHFAVTTMCKDVNGIIFFSGSKAEYSPYNSKCFAIKTLEGWHEVTPGDWIITGVKGEQYPCKDEIFQKTYEPYIEYTPI